AEDVLDGVLRCFLVSEFLRPLRAARAVGAGTRALVFRVSRRLLALGLPVIPTFGLDVTAQLAADERRRAVVAPGAAEQRGRAFARELAVEEDIAERFVLRRA